VTRIGELETENAALRERVAQLDERTNTLSKEIVRAKFRGQQQVKPSFLALCIHVCQNQ